MAEAWLSLLLLAGGGLLLRIGGLVLARGLSAQHPLIAWATAVGQATLAAFVVFAFLAPAGPLAAVPPAARAGGVALGLLVLALARGRLLPALAAGVLPVWWWG
ncbi:MAG: hypothetical protein N2Z67_05650 [Acetobacteraceae bacterium]|nr:hypothetical protein [Acetobacteraceae bacterium]